MKTPPALPSQCICRQSKSCNFTCQICTADLQANIKIVGDAHNILMLHGVVGQTLHSLMVQKGHQQLLLTLHLYSCSEGALACIKPIEHTLRLQKCAHKLVMHWAKHYLASALCEKVLCSQPCMQLSSLHKACTGYYQAHRAAPQEAAICPPFSEAVLPNVDPCSGE